MMMILPMLLDTKEEPFDHPDYLFEPKANGVRLLLDNTINKRILYTRHQTELTSRLPEIMSLHLNSDMVLDGELVCYYPEDPLKEDFEATMSRVNSSHPHTIKRAAAASPCTLIVFDILRYKGEMITHLPLIERKQILDNAVEDQPHLRKTLYVPEAGKTLFKSIQAFELEGIVAKAADSTYSIGVRGVSKRPKNRWCKIINWQIAENCVIVGYRKEQTGFYLAQERKGELVRIGFVEFGISSTNRTAFYRAAKDLVINESAGSVWITPIITCIVKHRGFLRSGNAMTPVFVKFTNSSPFN